MESKEFALLLIMAMALALVSVTISHRAEQLTNRVEAIETMHHIDNIDKEET